MFLYDVVDHFKQHYSRDRTKMGIKEGRKTKERVFLCILCNIFLHLKSVQLVNISIQKSTVGFPFNHAICVSIQIDRGQFCT